MSHAENMRTVSCKNTKESTHTVLIAASVVPSMQKHPLVATNVSDLPPELVLVILGLVDDARAFSEVCRSVWHACRSALCVARTFAFDFKDDLLLEDVKRRRANKKDVLSMISLNEDKYRYLIRSANHHDMPPWTSATIALQGPMHPCVMEKYASVLARARMMYPDSVRLDSESSDQDDQQMLPLRVFVSDTFEADDDQVDRLVDMILEGSAEYVLDLRFILDWRSQTIGLYQNMRPVARLLAGLSSHIWYLYVRDGRLSFAHLLSVLTQPFSSLISLDLMGTSLLADDTHGGMLECITSAMMRADSFKTLWTLNVIHTGIDRCDIKIPARTLAPNLRFLYTGFLFQRDVTVTTWTTRGKCFVVSASITCV